jgi:GDP-4-dehydro-6-deoxy-D-mannose reductase
MPACVGDDAGRGGGLFECRVRPGCGRRPARDLLAAQYFANYGFPTVRIRIFNTTGPGKEGDVCADLTRRVIEIELGMRPPTLMAGNLLTRRAIVDARDLVRGLWLSTEHCAPGDVYNLGGDKIYSVQELIDTIRALARTEFSVEQDPALMRRCDEPVIAGDISKFRSCTGWATELELAQTLRDMLDWWRRRLGAPVSPEAATESRPSEVSA